MSASRKLNRIEWDRWLPLLLIAVGADRPESRPRRDARPAGGLLGWRQRLAVVALFVAAA
tara:strand:+ start:3204 stop:3383 length:180 start_codon:yes stop_codon:yes gene_type:complete